MERVPMRGRKGILGLEKSRIWVVGGITVLVLNDSKMANQRSDCTGLAVTEKT